MPRYEKPEYEGDSRPETQKHIDTVNENGRKFCDKLMERLGRHDASKLVAPEHKYFDKGTPELEKSTYGEKSYDDAKGKIKEGLKHHYANNDHHPEHFGEEGISGMNLYQLVEMWLDWTAAVRRHADGNIFNSIMVNRFKRPEFHMDDQIFKIFLNTATEDFPEQMDGANDDFQRYLMEEMHKSGTGDGDADKSTEKEKSDEEQKPEE
jgi:hypothetical protein